MKKLFTLITITALSLGAYAQKEINFKVDYKPNSTYVINMDMNMDMEIKSMSEEGGEPFNQEMDMGFVYTLKTAAAKGNVVPFTAQMSVDSPLLGEVAEKMSEFKFYGKFVSNQPQIDSVYSPGMGKDAADDKMKEAMANMLNQFPVTDKKMKIGDSFTSKKIPMNVGGGLNLGENLDTSVTYTLKKIEGKKAYFDMLMDSPLDISKEGLEMKGNMKFTGQMVYNTETQFTESQNMDLTAGFKMDTKGMQMDMKMTGTNTITTKITPN